MSQPTMSKRINNFFMLKKSDSSKVSSKPILAYNLSNQKIIDTAQNTQIIKRKDKFTLNNKANHAESRVHYALDIHPQFSSTGAQK